MIIHSKFDGVFDWCCCVVTEYFEGNLLLRHGNHCFLIPAWIASEEKHYISCNRFSKKIQINRDFYFLVLSLTTIESISRISVKSDWDSIKFHWFKYLIRFLVYLHVTISEKKPGILSISMVGSISCTWTQQWSPKKYWISMKRFDNRQFSWIQFHQFQSLTALLTPTMPDKYEILLEIVEWMRLNSTSTR